ncbi:FAD-binding oxidoreductase [Halomicrobium salinisoli]|uniref:FAD-binding oxidoreductase n=1 Tax=Halomicrobium salinisoli TaxID=2878391 RepID=UPI001CF03760|nr:FAD-binding oxidoreductase [Halomicrobium salinisoli]
MVDVPGHMNHHERARRLPLVTESGRVTRADPMDRSRNRAVKETIREELAAVGHPEWLEAVADGADFDWEGLTRRLRSAGAGRRRIARIRTLAERFERPYPSLMRLGVTVDEPFEFAPGQYVTLRAHDTPRAYSLANGPSADELEFAIRRVPGGRLTSQLFEYARPGDEVVVRGPNGHMVLADPSDRDLVFMATGTGVAPFKSMIDHLYEQGWHEGSDGERDVWLFLGCAWEDDLPYREEFRALDREQPGFHFVPTLTREPLLSDWDGETDYVQQVFLKYVAEGALDGADLPERLAPFRDEDPATDVDARVRPAGVELYACGVSVMVDALVRAARAAGIPERHMQYEGFG